MTDKNTELVVAEGAMPVVAMDGFDMSDFQIPEVRLFQGENNMPDWGSHELGTLLDSSTKQPIDSRKFTPIRAHKNWVRYEDGPDGTTRELYRFNDKRKVPPGDLEWRPNPKGGDKNLPPLCAEYSIWVVIFEGQFTPHLLVFKSSSGKEHTAASGVLVRREAARAMQIKAMHMAKKDTNDVPACLYELDFSKRSGTKNGARTTWLVPVVREAGAASPDLTKIAAQWFNTLSGMAVINVGADAGADSAARHVDSTAEQSDVGDTKADGDIPF